MKILELTLLGFDISDTYASFSTLEFVTVGINYSIEVKDDIVGFDITSSNNVISIP